LPNRADDLRWKIWAIMKTLPICFLSSGLIGQRFNHQRIQLFVHQSHNALFAKTYWPIGQRFNHQRIQLFVHQSHNALFAKICLRFTQAWVNLRIRTNRKKLKSTTCNPSIWTICTSSGYLDALLRMYGKRGMCLSGIRLGLFIVNHTKEDVWRRRELTSSSVKIIWKTTSERTYAKYEERWLRSVHQFGEDIRTYEGRSLTKEGIAIMFGQNSMENNVGKDVSEVWRMLASKCAPIRGRIQGRMHWYYHGHNYWLFLQLPYWLEAIYLFVSTFGFCFVGFHLWFVILRVPFICLIMDEGICQKRCDL